MKSVLVYWICLLYTSLIDDMLVLSQIENAKPDSTEQRCDVAQEIRETVARLYPIAEKENISLKVELKDGIWVACSSSRLQQMLGNLIENAIKYNKPNGSVKITAEESRQMAVDVYKRQDCKHLSLPVA